MEETKIKLAHKDIDEALNIIENLEKELSSQSLSREHLRERFVFLTEKLQEIEGILKDEGVLE